jgi:hypothetical protein
MPRPETVVIVLGMELAEIALFGHFRMICAFLIVESNGSNHIFWGCLMPQFGSEGIADIGTATSRFCSDIVTVRTIVTRGK